MFANMVTIQSICNSIKEFINKHRTPFPQISRSLVVCSTLKRPGLSTILSVSNIVNDLNKLGIPTGPMPDGTPNLTIAFVFASVKEVYRAAKHDMSIQVGFLPGSLGIVGEGHNAAGSFVVWGKNVSNGFGTGLAT